jgi:hypothetical protein
MNDIASLRAQRADLTRRQDEIKERHRLALQGADYLDHISDLLDIFVPDGCLRLANFTTSADEVEALVEHLSRTIKPDVPATWTCSRYRRANGSWNQSFWIILQHHDKVEGKSEHREKMRAVHAGYFDLLARALELRIVELGGRIYRLQDREETREARVLFDERMRLIEESVSLVAQRRAQQEDRDAEWHRAAPGRTEARV